MIWSNDGRMTFPAESTGDKYVRERDGTWYFESCSGCRIRINDPFYHPPPPEPEEERSPPRPQYMPPSLKRTLRELMRIVRTEPIRRIVPRARTSC